MDTFFAPGGVLQSDPFQDFRIPYAGSIPPPGFTLYQDSIYYVHLGPQPPIYSTNYYHNYF